MAGRCIQWWVSSSFAANGPEFGTILITLQQEKSLCEALELFIVRFHEHYCEKTRPQVSCSFLSEFHSVACDHYIAVSAKVLRWPQPGCSQIGIRRREFKSGGEARLPENQETVRDGMRITEYGALVIASWIAWKSAAHVYYVDIHCTSLHNQQYCKD